MTVELECHIIGKKKWNEDFFVVTDFFLSHNIRFIKIGRYNLKINILNLIKLNLNFLAHRSPLEIC